MAHLQTAVMTGERRRVTEVQSAPSQGAAPGARWRWWRGPGGDTVCRNTMARESWARDRGGQCQQRSDLLAVSPGGRVPGC